MNDIDFYLSTQPARPGEPASPQLLYRLLGIDEASAASRSQAVRRSILGLLTAELAAERQRADAAWTPRATALDRPHNAARLFALAEAAGQERSWLAYRKLVAARRRRQAPGASGQRRGSPRDAIRNLAA